MDNSSGIRVQGFDTLFPQDSRCLRCERARSAFDTRHRFVAGGTYDLPIGQDKLLNLHNRVANSVLAGWQTSTSVTIQSGVPQNIGFGGADNASTGNGGYDRPIATLVGNGFVANHPSWGAPNGNIMAGAAFPGAPANAAHQGFGVISTTAIPMRQLQLGLKYSF